MSSETGAGLSGRSPDLLRSAAAASAAAAGGQTHVLAEDSHIAQLAAQPAAAAPAAATACAGPAGGPAAGERFARSACFGR